MACDVNVISIANVLLEWEPIGEITGFADGENSIEIEPSDEGENKMKVSADGTSGTISVSGKRNGQCTVKLEPGSPYHDLLEQSWANNKAARGTLTATDTVTGKSYAMECATLMNAPTVGFGSESSDSYDYVFLYLNLNVTPSARAAGRLAGAF